MSNDQQSAPLHSGHIERRLAAILSADVKGYSRLMGEDEVATIRTLTAYRVVISSLIQHYRGRVVFVQLAAPSRTHIKRYRDLQLEVEQTLEAVNRAVGTRTWRPIVYLERHHERRDIWPVYRHADFCMVTALHDGMNLVAKEFVSVRDDDDGVLILSRFTGAARELRDALLVNPYDLDEMAEAIRAAVEMPAEERTLRMTRMRRVVREHNIYRWAGLLLSELSRIPVEVAGAA